MDANLAVAGHPNGRGFYVPQYGTFLPPPENGAGLVSDFEAPHMLMQRVNPDLEGIVRYDGVTEYIVDALIRDGSLPDGIQDGHYLITDKFEFSSLVFTLDGFSVVRRSSLHHMFDAYVSSRLVDGVEGEFSAFGFVASDWLDEPDVGVVDKVWPAIPGDIASKVNLYRAIEHDLRQVKSVLRLCSSVDLAEEGVFFADLGYRFMERNDAGYAPGARLSTAGRVDMVKVLYPAFNPADVDRVH